MSSWTQLFMHEPRKQSQNAKFIHLSGPPKKAERKTMTKKRGHGDGAIDARGENWRLRYRVDGRRFTKTVRGTKGEAQKALRDLLHAGDNGAHVAPDKVTLKEWIEHWISIGCPGNKRRAQVGQRSIERYAELLRCHVVPALGERSLQQLQASDIDALYTRLAGKVAPRTAHHVHTVLGACLGAAVRTGKVAHNPMLRLAKVPSPGEADHGMALEAEQLRVLVHGFKGSALFPIVAVAAFTGARRNEVLALQWGDLDPAAKTLRIERAIEETDARGLQIKGPKTERGKRTIAIDDDLIALLVAERERHARIVAGVPDGVAVDLSLVKLPPGVLMFPNPPAPGESFSLTKLRNPRNTTKEFVRKATGLGFKGLRFHDLRGTHETLLLDAGVPVHVVAARCGHDAAVLLRSYAKRTRKADVSAADAISVLSKGALA
jgi:integrase